MKSYLLASFCATLLGVLLVVEPPISAAPYSILRHFKGTNYADGDGPSHRLVLSGQTLYGTTYAGGTSNRGTIYKINTDGSGYDMVYRCSFSDAAPTGPLTLMGSSLYCTALGGGMRQTSVEPDMWMEARGAVFRVNTNGSDYSSIVTWGASYIYGVGIFYYPSLEAFPHSGIALSGQDLYGVAGNHTLFTVQTNGTGYRLLNTLGGMSWSPLTLFGDTLYGTTFDGGISNHGTLFAINTANTNQTVLKEFAAPFGASPDGMLLITNDTIFGVTGSGGAFGKGTVFRMNTNGGDFTVLKHFSGGDGMYPHSGLVCGGAKLYGTTGSGGMFNHGTVFQTRTNGTGFVTLKHFNGADGDEPSGELVLSDNTLYGTAVNGGDFDLGVVFSLKLGLQLLNPACDSTNFTFSILTTSNFTYAVESCDDLSLTNWQQFDTVIGNDAVVNYAVPMTNGPQRFFRVRQD